MDINNEDLKSTCNYKDCIELTSNRIGWCNSCINKIKESNCTETKLARWCLEVHHSLQARNGIALSEESELLIDEIKKKLNSIHRLEQGLMKVGNL